MSLTAIARVGTLVALDFRCGEDKLAHTDVAELGDERNTAYSQGVDIAAVGIEFLALGHIPGECLHGVATVEELHILGHLAGDDII